MTDAPTPPDRDGNAPPAFRAGFTRDWPAYFAAVKGDAPRETCLRAIRAFEAEGIPDAVNEPPIAVDLACGEGRDTQALLEAGFRTVAIDASEDAFHHMQARGFVGHPMLDCRLEPMEEASIPACTLLNASFALPFCHPDRFDALWTIIRAAIEPGGRFAGQLFGDRDTWASIPDRSHHTRAQAEALLAPFEVEYFQEDEKDSADAEGNTKHWHVFHIVARQPADD